MLGFILYHLQLETVETLLKLIVIFFVIHIVRLVWFLSYLEVLFTRVSNWYRQDLIAVY